MTIFTRRRRGDEGFGLIDAIVAFTVLLVVLTPIVYLMTEVGAQTSANSVSVLAGQLAEQALENAGNLPLQGSNGLIAALSSGITTTPTVDGVHFTSFVQLSWSSVGPTKNLCTSGAPPQVILATANVSWPGGSVTENTAINPPYGALNPSDGFVPVEVTGGSNQPVKDVVVTVADLTNAADLNGGQPATYTTNALGCSFMELPAGDEYQFTLGPPAAYTSTTFPYISSAETPNPSTSMTAAVQPNGTVSSLISFNYDISGAIDVSNPSTTQVDRGVVCPTSTTCFALGQSSNSATVFAAVNSTSWGNLAMPSSPTPTLLTDVSCPSSTSCFFVGSSTTTSGSTSTSSGVLVSATYSSSVWQLANVSAGLPAGLTVSSFNSISCPSSTTCFAVGNGLSGTTPQGVIAAYNGSSWSTSVASTNPATTSIETLISIGCPSTTACVAVGSGADVNTSTTSTLILAYSPASSTLTVDTPPLAGVTVGTVSEVTCPAQASPTCMVTGTAAVAPATAQTPALLVTADAGTTWSAVGLTSAAGIGDVACASSTQCFVPVSLASGGAGPGSTSLVDTLNLVTGSAPQTWSASPEASPGSVTGSVAAVACPSSSSCLAAGQAGSTGYVGTSVSGGLPLGNTWTGVGLSAAATPGYFTSIACAGNGTFCAAAGEGASADLLDASTNGGSTWSANTSGFSGAGGINALGLPIAYTGATLPPLTVAESSAANAANPPPTLVSPLYPFTWPYTVFYGDCTDERSAGGTGTAVVTSSTHAPTSIGIGTLDLEILDPVGRPIPGANVTLTTSDATCPTDTYTLPPTGPDGAVVSGVPNTPQNAGTPYWLTMTVSAGAHTFPTVQLAVTPTGVVTSGSPSAYYPYPDPLIVEATS